MIENLNIQMTIFMVVLAVKPIFCHILIRNLFQKWDSLACKNVVAVLAFF